MKNLSVKSWVVLGGVVVLAALAAMARSGVVDISFASPPVENAELSQALSKVDRATLPIGVTRLDCLISSADYAECFASLSPEDARVVGRASLRWEWQAPAGPRPNDIQDVPRIEFSVLPSPNGGVTVLSEKDLENRVAFDVAKNLIASITQDAAFSIREQIADAQSSSPSAIRSTWNKQS